MDPALIEAMAAALDQEPAFAAEALALPGEATLADKMEIVDVDAIHAARDLARAAIGQALGDRLRAPYDASDRHRWLSRSTGRRSAGGRCATPASAYLVAAGDASAVQLAKAQFDAGQT